LRVLYYKIKPKDYPIFTKAISSGLDAWNVLMPFSILGVTLWQRDKQVIKSLTIKYLFLLKGLYFLPIFIH
jgi:hypothetical protein